MISKTTFDSWNRQNTGLKTGDQNKLYNRSKQYSTDIQFIMSRKWGCNILKKDSDIFQLIDETAG